MAVETNTPETLGIRSNRTPGLNGPRGRGSRMMLIFCMGG